MKQHINVTRLPQQKSAKHLFNYLAQYKNKIVVAGMIGFAGCVFFIRASIYFLRLPLYSHMSQEFTNLIDIVKKSFQSIFTNF